MITPGTGPFPRRTNPDLFVARRPVERFAVVIDPELVIVDTLRAQPISTIHFLIKGINQALLLGLKFCLFNLTTQGLDFVPGRVKLLLDARREWVHNGVREVKAIIIVYSRPVGVERGVFKIKVTIRSNCWRQYSFEGCPTTSIHNGFNQIRTQTQPVLLPPRALGCQRSAAICGHHQQS